MLIQFVEGLQVSSETENQLEVSRVRRQVFPEVPQYPLRNSKPTQRKAERKIKHERIQAGGGSIGFVRTKFH